MNKDILKVGRSTSLKKLLSLFKNFHTIPLIPVVDETEQLVGAVSLNNLIDILKFQESHMLRNNPFVEEEEDVFDLEVSPAMGELILVDDIMESNILSLKEDTLLETAYKSMRLYNKEQLPVIDEGNRLLGIIGTFDIICQMFKEKGIV